MFFKTSRLFLGVDVGTGSARAGIFMARGRMLGSSSHPIRLWKPAPAHAPRPDPHRRQLERPVARPRRHAQPQRLPHQGRRQIPTLWSGNFDDEYFLTGLARWLKTDITTHRTPHVHTYAKATVPAMAKAVGRKIATDLKVEKSIMSIFDEGCMGMYNAIIPDDLLYKVGVCKERLSQSALYYAATQVSDQEATEVFNWYIKRGLRFHFGRDEATELTKNQVLWQCKIYIAACRIADEFGCESIGIPYQHLLPASDLVEGTLNSTVRPPVKNVAGKVIRAGQPIVHFNEVDECAGLDSLFTNRVHAALGQPVANTLHDLRWGDWDKSGSTEEYVWIFLISGSAPTDHHIDGWAGSDSLRQPPMYFRLSGGTLRGVAKPGEIVWSRVFVQGSKLKMDIGRRWKKTTPQWPIIHAVTRDLMMARHQANHIQVAYANSAAAADLAACTKGALAAQLGIEESFCGTKSDGSVF